MRVALAVLWAPGIVWGCGGTAVREQQAPVPTQQPAEQQAESSALRDGDSGFELELACAQPHAAQDSARIAERLRAAHLRHEVEVIAPNRLRVRFAGASAVVLPELFQQGTLEVAAVVDGTVDLGAGDVAPPLERVSISSEGLFTYAGPLDALSAALEARAPSGTRFSALCGAAWGGCTAMFVRPSALGREDLASAEVVQTDNPQPQVMLELTDAGRQRFARLTADNVGKRIAFLIDGVPSSAPLVAEPIVTGRAFISIGPDLEYDDALVSARAIAHTLSHPLLACRWRLELPR